MHTFLRIKTPLFPDILQEKFVEYPSNIFYSANFFWLQIAFVVV